VVERKDLVRGVQVERDRYVVIEEEDLKALRLESTKVIDIERFVEASSIDRIYWDEPYFLVPDGKPAQDPYAVIREAMATEGRVALGRPGDGQPRADRGHRGPRAGGCCSPRCTAMTRCDPRRTPSTTSPTSRSTAHGRHRQADHRPGAGAVRPRPSSTTATREAVRALVEAKTEGAELHHRPAAGPKESNVIDLMEALRRSLKAPPRGPAPERAEAQSGEARTGRQGGGRQGAGRQDRQGGRSRGGPAASRKGGSHAPRRAAG
jgi:DNA end-binding protein Ku